jgi:hypothetical protein
VTLRRRFSLAWLVWLASFAVLEGIALWRPEPGDTLSEHVFAFLDGGPARYVLLGGFLSWLVLHFMGKGKIG